jgi:hypothetical protein
LNQQLKDSKRFIFPPDSDQPRDSPEQSSFSPPAAADALAESSTVLVGKVSCRANNSDMLEHRNDNILNMPPMTINGHNREGDF